VIPQYCVWVTQTQDSLVEILLLEFDTNVCVCVCVSSGLCEAEGHGGVHHQESH